jgi:hypothetical protein
VLFSPLLLTDDENLPGGVRTAPFFFALLFFAGEGVDNAVLFADDALGSTAAAGLLWATAGFLWAPSDGADALSLLEAFFCRVDAAVFAGASDGCA